MQPKYKSLFTRRAYEDLRGIYKYISEELQNPGSAIQMINDIEERIGILKEFPQTGSLVKDTLLQAKGYRKLIMFLFQL